MDGFGVHAFRLVNAKSDVVFAKFHWKSQQGVKSLSTEETAAIDFNYATKDLYAAIRAGNSPKWDLYVQLLRPEEVAKLDYNAFDATKIWDGIPETKFGTMTLNRVPENFFQSTELAAFSPGVMVPGIETSPDRLLQGRLFSNADTQRYRIGANYQALEVNKPLVQIANNNQDSALNFVERTGEVNYQPSGATGDQCLCRLAPVPLQPVQDRRGHRAGGDQEGRELPPARRALPLALQGAAGLPDQESRGRPSSREEPSDQGDCGQQFL
jgi:catalase